MNDDYQSNYMTFGIYKLNNMYSKTDFNAFFTQ